ncbi:MAG: translation elongation factor Ts [Thermodesulfobacteriota bacterium]
MEISTEMVREIRKKTGAGVMDCKKALLESKGNFDAAIIYLREKGLAAARKRVDKVAAEGLVGSYIHQGGKIGVLVEINCETDFVAKTDEFKSLLKDLTMHIAATNPIYVRSEDILNELIEKEKSIFRAQALESGKPEKVIEKIVEGKLGRFFSEVCLMEQSFIKNPDITIQQLLTENISKLGENLSVRRFVRYNVGEGIEKESSDFAKEVKDTL